MTASRDKQTSEKKENNYFWINLLMKSQSQEPKLEVML